MNSAFSFLSSKYRTRKKNWVAIKIGGFSLNILHGTVSQCSLPTSVAGTQCTACAMTALSISVIKNVSTWDSQVVDDVIRIGTKRHEECEDKDARGFADVSSFLVHTGIPGYEGIIILKEELPRNGSMSSRQGISLEIPTATDLFADFIARKRNFIVTLNAFTVGVVVEGDYCYLFNSHPCNDMGLPTSDGCGCVLQIPISNAHEALEFIISTNYGPNMISANIQSCVYCMVGLSVESFDTQASGSVPSRASDSDNSESDFNLKKSKLPMRASSSSGFPDSNKFQNIPGGFHVFKNAPLPIEYSQLTKWFQNADVNCISTVCASSNVIKHNMIAVYSAKAMQTTSDFYWRKDGFSWKSGPHNQLPRDDPKFKIVYHYLKTDIKGVRMTRTEVSPLVLKDGKHDWKELQSHQWPLVMVHYKASGDLEQVLCMPHGNRKYTPQKRSSKTATELITNTPTTPEFEREYRLPPHEPKSKLLRGAIRKKLQFTKTPYQTFAAQRAECESMDSVSAERMRPRNVHQIKSVKSAMKKEGSFQDPVLLLVHHSILHKDLLPIYARKDGFLHVVAALPPLDKHFGEFIAAGKKIILHYDTTFDCGNFFVSIVVFRHHFLQNSPIVPLRFLFHEDKSTFGHDLHFNNLLQSFPLLKKSQVVLVTDREATFKNMKQRYLPLSTHIFCHLHIYRNIEEWCKKHAQSTKAKIYCDDVRRLLHCSTEENFHELLESYELKWSDTFFGYFNSRLHADVQNSSKFSVEHLIHFDKTSGVTNNASEAANAAYKQWLSERKSMYEAVLLAYFYQITKYGDIADAFAGRDSNFKRNRKALAPKFVFEPTNDIFSDLGLSSIFKKGKFSNNVTKFQPENIEIKSTLGLAWWFIKSQRISYQDQDCFVKGLNNRSFNVDATRKTCTCLRPSCSHLQAVLLQQRRPLPKVHGRYNLTKLSEVYRPLKRAGKKLSDKLRKRGRLSLQHEQKIELIERAKSMACKNMAVPLNSLSENQIEKSNKLNGSLCEDHDNYTEKFNEAEENVESCEDTGPQSPQLPSTVKNIEDMFAMMPFPVAFYDMTQLPLLSARNAQDTVFTIGNQALNLQDLKSLDEDIHRGEEAAMKKLNKGFQKGYISDGVINAFIQKLAGSDIALVSSSYATLAAENGSHKKLQAAIKVLQNSSWDDKTLVLLPFTRSSGVWNLGVIQFTTGGVIVSVIDPLNPLETEETLANSLHSFVTALKPNMSTKFQIRPPAFKVPQQIKPSCSGVLVCMYAFCFANKVSMSSSISSIQMRNFILSAICGRCVVKCRKDRLHCSACGDKRSEDKMVSCDYCHQWTHYCCLDVPVDISFSEMSFTCGEYQVKCQ